MKLIHNRERSALVMLENLPGVLIGSTFSRSKSNLHEYAGRLRGATFSRSKSNLHEYAGRLRGASTC